MSRRKDGSGYVLKTTTVKATFNLLQAIRAVILSCPSMYYKTNWDFRFNKEVKEWAAKFPDYEVIASSSERNMTYSDEHIELLIRLKLIGYTVKDIAELLHRSYSSVVYKWGEIKKESLELIKCIAS